MEKKGLGIGKSDFKSIIQENCYYADKTNLMEEILKDKAEVKLFTRPRRCGKTLNMSMLKYFFDIKEAEKNRELFTGLNIEKSPYISEQGKYPVIFISLKDIKMKNFEETLEQTKIQIGQLFKENIEIYDSLNFLDKEPFRDYYQGKVNKIKLINSLKFLSQLLHDYYKQKVIILIDEYDTPLVTAYEKGYYDEAIDFFRGLYSSVLKDNPYIHMGVMTGILRIAKEGIFSGLNNLSVNSILEKKYSEYFGLTEKDVEKAITYYELVEIQKYIIHGVL